VLCTGNLTSILKQKEHEKLEISECSRTYRPQQNNLKTKVSLGFYFVHQKNEDSNAPGYAKVKTFNIHDHYITIESVVHFVKMQAEVVSHESSLLFPETFSTIFIGNKFQTNFKKSFDVPRR
jgi:hypothetical protein